MGILHRTSILSTTYSTSMILSDDHVEESTLFHMTRVVLQTKSNVLSGD